MNWFSGILVYIIVWWLVLFMVLPWGARRPEDPEPGHAESAPAEPRMALKFTVTTVLAAVVWVAIYLIVESDLISFRAPVREM